MPARLVPVNERGIAPIVIQRPVMLIGRHSDCDVRLDRAQVSRRHCCLAQAYERLLIRDLGSRNGVRVNGLVVEEAQLLPGDEVAIAHLIYRYEPEAAPAPVPAPGATNTGHQPSATEKGKAAVVDEDDDDGLIPFDLDL